MFTHVGVGKRRRGRNSYCDFDHFNLMNTVNKGEQSCFLIGFCQQKSENPNSLSLIGTCTECHSMRFINTPHPSFSSALVPLIFSRACPHSLSGLAYSGQFTLTGFPQHPSANLASSQTSRYHCFAQIDVLLYPGLERSLYLSALSQLPPTRLLCSNYNKKSFDGILGGLPRR